MSLDVLAFAAHPDDAELWCGGILISCVDRGRSAGIVDLTRGEMASRGTPDVRAREAEEASRVLGLSVRENLGLPDTGLDASDDGQARAVVAVLRRLRPEIVLVPWVRQRHPDHAAASALLRRAIFLAGLRRFEADGGDGRFVAKQVLHYEERHRMRPTFVVDTSSAWDRKLQAIRCHGSQLDAAPGEDPTLIGSSLALQAVEARDRARGALIGTTHGEALRSESTPGLADLVGHYRANPFAEPHLFEDGA